MRKLVNLFLFFVLASSLVAEGVGGFDTTVVNCVMEINARNSSGSEIVVFPLPCDSMKMGEYFDDLRIKYLIAENAKKQAYKAQAVPNDASLQNLVGTMTDERILSKQSASSNADTPETNPDVITITEDFNIFQRVGAAVLNIFGGLGSFLMGDTGGGILIVATSVMSPFLIATFNDDPLTNLIVTTAVAESIGIFRAATFHKPGFDIAVFPALSEPEQSTVKLMYTVKY